jgi:hypothetical protein
MNNRMRHVCGFWQAALILLHGSILSSYAQDVDERFPAMPQHAPPKITRYVDTLLARHDRNGDGRLEPAEWQGMQGTPQTIDRNHDGDLAESELLAHVLSYARARMPVSPDDAGEGASSTQDYLPPPIVLPQDNGASAQTGPVTDHVTATHNESATNDEPAAPGEAGSSRSTKFVVRPSRATHNLPEWFLSLDADGDRQLTLREFGTDSAGRSREFERLDQNGDGLLTPQEMTAPPPAERSP